MLCPGVCLIVWQRQLLAASAREKTLTAELEASLSTAQAVSQSLDTLQQSHSEHHAQTREDLGQARRELEAVTRERDSALQELAAHVAAQRHAADEVERATTEARSLRAERERLDHALTSLQVLWKCQVTCCGCVVLNCVAGPVPHMQFVHPLDACDLRSRSSSVVR